MNHLYLIGTLDLLAFSNLLEARSPTLPQQVLRQSDFPKQLFGDCYCWLSCSLNCWPFNTTKLASTSTSFYWMKPRLYGASTTYVNCLPRFVVAWELNQGFEPYFLHYFYCVSFRGWGIRRTVCTTAKFCSWVSDCIKSYEDSSATI